MIDQFVPWIQYHQDKAPWILFTCILLAGLNIPISLDAIVIIAALLAATAIPEKVYVLYFSIFLGSIFSAWISYWLGRKLGHALLKVPFFSKWMPQQRLVKIKNFYELHGLWTLLVGRFIPFGVRNCIFFTTGLSKMSFSRFIYRDFIACLLWSSLSFYLFYTLGINYHLLIHYVKRFNLFIFLTFGITLIGYFCYKRVKKRN